MKTNMIMGTLAFALSLACAAFAQTPARPCGPTATEVFHLRTECAALGKEIWEEQKRQQKDTGVGYTIHYDLQANRCYVRTTTALRNLTDDGHSRTTFVHILYDGQSHEALASTVSGGSLGSPDDDYGKIGADGMLGHAAYLKAEAFIDEHMRDK